MARRFLAFGLSLGRGVLVGVLVEPPFDVISAESDTATHVDRTRHRVAAVAALVNGVAAQPIRAASSFTVINSVICLLSKRY